MGLTEKKIQDLRDKRFDRLYEQDEKEWDILVGNAYDFAKTNVSAGGEPRPDDILKMLIPMLEVNKRLRDHQEDNKAKYKFYREYFGDYIVDMYLQKQAMLKGKK